MIGPQTAIVPVLNGIDHVETMRHMVGAGHVLGGQTAMTAHVVEPGVVNLDVSKAAAPYGLYYAPDPSSQPICTIGGNVAEDIFNKGLCLPSGTALTEQDLDRVAKIIKNCGR